MLMTEAGLVIGQVAGVALALHRRDAQLVAAAHVLHVQVVAVAVVEITHAVAVAVVVVASDRVVSDRSGRSVGRRSEISAEFAQIFLSSSKLSFGKNLRVDF